MCPVSDRKLPFSYFTTLSHEYQLTSTSASASRVGHYGTIQMLYYYNTSMLCYDPTNLFTF